MRNLRAQVYKKWRPTWLALLLLVGLLLPLHFSLAFPGEETVAKFVNDVCTSIGGFFLFVGAVLLDTSIYYLVVKMGDFFKPGNGMGLAVSAGWVLIRDLINMLFIFGLIFIGIKTILESEDSGTRRTLGFLIAAALLINFSLFFTQVVVDFSNLVASQIYHQIIDGQTIATGADEKADAPISEAFQDAVNVNSFFSEEGVEFGNSLLYSLLTLIFFVFAGMAFGIGSIYIVTRFVALLLYMVFSPVMFLGWILPKFQSMSNKWWEGFFKYCFFAPVYLFVIYLSIFILRGIVADTGTSSAIFAGGVANPKGATVSFVLLIMNFVIMIGLLWGSLKVGDKLSIAGSKMAMNGFNRMAGAATIGSAGWLGRNTIGWYANRYAESESAQRRARSGGLRGAIGRRLLLGADSARNASFDARGIGNVNKTFGKGQKGGYVERQKAINKYEQKVAGLVGDSDTQFYENAGVADIHKIDEQHARARSSLLTTLANTKDPAKRQQISEQIKKAGERHAARLASDKGEIYSELKKNMKKMVKEDYAKNLEKRGNKLPPGLKQLYKGLIRSSAENKTAANSLRKDLGKSDTEKALKLLQDSIEKK